METEEIGLVQQSKERKRLMSTSLVSKIPALSSAIFWGEGKRKQGRQGKQIARCRIRRNH